ncbi:LysR family transcriptional regulator [Verrucomicrobium sp. BvORR106]|uniref:LysR family transcriptional regulator n=1 Tax=Verrucomicrobium sp. BvORR106 TaxID=1403819 RepID=UPI00056FC32F|nr:LysR family transcriptional regulator [Verrucomicrobium sp. BvORR106]
MDIRELRSFVTLAEQLHFGRAAKLLNLSQPALTKQILRMEEDLGSPLFERDSHGTQLSATGRRFLQEARPVLAAFERLLTQGRQSALGETGSLHVAFGFHTFELVPRLMVKFREQCPEVEVSLRDLSSAEQIEGLSNGRIDLGFVRQPAPSHLQSMPVIKDRLSLVSSSNSPLRENATLADCRNERFVAISEKRAPGFHHHMLLLCAKHGFHPRIIQEVSEITTALALVRAGLGLAVVPQSTATSEFAGIRFHPLRDKEAAWTVGAAWRKGDSNPVLKRFLDLLRRETSVNGRK